MIQALSTSHNSSVIQTGTDSAEKFIWNTFRQLECPMHFKDLTYVGVRTGRPPTDFTQFQRTMSQHLQDKSNRAARRPAIVYKTLKVQTFVHNPSVNSFSEAKFCQEFWRDNDKKVKSCNNYMPVICQLCFIFQSSIAVSFMCDVFDCRIWMTNSMEKWRSHYMGHFLTSYFLAPWSACLVGKFTYLVLALKIMYMYHSYYI